MATAPPDPHPDSPPQGDDETPDQLTPETEAGRESVEDVPEDTKDYDEGSPLERSGVPNEAGTGA